MKEEKTYLYYKATGPLKYNMTNDYLFRMVLQKDPETLIRLICSLLHLDRNQVIEAYIDNPVTPGEAISDKEYQLDIIVILNGNITINLEMQVINYKNWTARSLSYLCRKFDNVARGDDYNNANTVYQIGFLDFTLFENHPEFLAKHQMRNAKDNFLYTDKFNLYVLELNHTDMATSEDRLYDIDIWAKLFKAKTWEEIKMITKDNPSMNSTAETIFMSIANEKILEQCRIREDNIAHEKYQNDLIKALTSDNKSLSDENKSLSDENKSLFDENLRLIKLLEENGIKP